VCTSPLSRGCRLSERGLFLGRRASALPVVGEPTRERERERERDRPCALAESSKTLGQVATYGATDASRTTRDQRPLHWVDRSTGGRARGASIWDTRIYRASEISCRRKLRLIFIIGLLLPADVRRETRYAEIRARVCVLRYLPCWDEGDEEFTSAPQKAGFVPATAG